jgi:3-(3-hydroxy-phenyl)propionate hydroxylase
MPGESKEWLEHPDTAWSLLAPYVTPDQVELIHADLYRFRSRMVKEWHRGRLFVAGDAAHEMTPKMGQGLCSGFRDTINLAWKLGMVVKGCASPELLETYGVERAPHVREFIVGSHQLIRMMAEMAEQADPYEGEPQLMPALRPRLGPGLHADMAEPAGTLSEQPSTDDGRRLDDIVGYRFAVIGDPDVLKRTRSHTRATWEQLDAAVLEVSALGVQVADWQRRLDTAAVIVRPDRYIFGIASDASALDTLTERLASEVSAAGAAR